MNVKKFWPDENGEMEEDESGAWIYHTDYQALKSHCEYLQKRGDDYLKEAESNFDKIQYLKKEIERISNEFKECADQKHQILMEKLELEKVLDGRPDETKLP